MNDDKQVNPVAIAGGGAALLTVLLLHKKRRAKKAAKRVAKLDAARVKLDAAAEQIEALQPKKAAKYMAQLDAARAKLDAAVEKAEGKKPKKAKAEKKSKEKKSKEKKVKEKKARKEKPLALQMEITEKKAPRPSDNLLRDILLLSGRYKLKSKKKRTKPLALIILLYLVEQIYREWEREEEPVSEDGSEPAAGKKKGKSRK